MFVQGVPSASYMARVNTFFTFFDADNSGEMDEEELQVKKGR